MIKSGIQSPLTITIGQSGYVFVGNCGSCSGGDTTVYAPGGDTPVQTIRLSANTAGPFALAQPYLGRSKVKTVSLPAMEPGDVRGTSLGRASLRKEKGQPPAMKILALGRDALGVCASFALLAACNSNGSQIVPSAVRQQIRGSMSGSWMKPDANSEQLLYVSDPGTNDVQVYNYPKIGTPSLQGTLTGFSDPRGECVDATGDVWITNTNASTIVEFAHGGTKPIATLSDPGQSPTSCAINVASGDLAVVNLMSGSKAGSVSIYKNASGSPTTYSVGEIVQPLFVTYDDAFLYVDGLLSSGKPGIALKRPKNQHFTENGLLVNIGSIGNIQWDGTYLAVGDGTAGNNVIYRFGVSTRRKVVLKQTVQIRNACEMMQFFVTATSVVVPDASCPSANTYKYPGGGLPMAKKVITQNLVAPFGSAISPKLTP